ncbi:hypothetical protein SAMN06272722_110131 [Paenibacillus sp. RU5A]|nr:hypothetical protein SAMN03159332_6262 [Paenibacillus sp. 276b]SLK16315.1 hypothetical protein SAMN06272722_110131 [Paenibacillus sp. RU5A]SOC74318.1 hypothetical protein SAMN05880581_110131 [Paenibacillus sp. RU26A]SOC76454.1 hypothetical protein SAMN05880586_110131 [Paenibacillus sp. RU5M]
MSALKTSIELLASYQGNRSQVLKDKRIQQEISLADYLSDEEREDLLHTRNMSRIVSHCNFAIQTIGYPIGEKVDDKHLSILSEIEVAIIKQRLEEGSGFDEIGKVYGYSPAVTKDIFSKALRKLTKHIRDNTVGNEKE